MPEPEENALDRDDARKPSNQHAGRASSGSKAPVAPDAPVQPKEGAPSTGQMREAAGGATEPHASGDLEAAKRDVEGAEDLS